ncbi:MAG: polynucleotide adenylyltransferase [Spirochaetae bacterium HGW-Spirochaetae-9]|nr:MAG: polynucleotide adenylyltransferase [Spirochaetae bacterium HGW-Spirochaetae-9]
MLPLFRIPEEIRHIAETVRNTGKKAYIVGGALRDYFLRRPVINDYDMATDASPQEITSLFPRVIPTGIKHGTVTILAGRYAVEMTTFRVEGVYADGRRPDAVTFVADIDEDLSRRDFTMNAMAFDPISAELHDPFGGQSDIKKRSIRSVGNPALRFAEDGLRALRAIRFSAQLGFSIEEATFSAIPSTMHTFRQVSRERVRDELQKILLSSSPSTGLRLLESSGLLAEILPELLPARGCQQKGMHAFDVMDHLYLSVDAARSDLIIRLAALFHDAGKPAACAPGQDGSPTFYNHEAISARLASVAMRRLKFSNETIDAVLHLVKNHMFNYTENWTDAAVRRFIARVGPESIEDLFFLRIADAAATAGTKPDARPLEPFRKRLESILAEAGALSLKDLAVSGNDLATIGIPRGPAMGRILGALLETVLDDPAQNTKASLLRIAESMKSRLLRGKACDGIEAAGDDV